MPWEDKAGAKVFREVHSLENTHYHMLKRGTNPHAQSFLTSLFKFGWIEGCFFFAGQTTSTFNLFTVQLPLFLATLVFQNEHWLYSATLQVVHCMLGPVFSQCDHNSRSWGQFGGSPIRKPQRKEQPAFRQRVEHGSNVPLLMEKVCKCSFFFLSCQGLL